jgi:hypothetical protein
MPLFHRGPDQFPPIKDLRRDLPDVSVIEANRALEALRRHIVIDVARVYIAHDSHGRYWQVWLDVTQRRMTLAEWATEWLARHPQQQSQEGV